MLSLWGREKSKRYFSRVASSRKHLLSLYFILFPPTGNQECPTNRDLTLIDPTAYMLALKTNNTSRVCALIHEQQYKSIFPPQQTWSSAHQLFLIQPFNPSSLVSSRNTSVSLLRFAPVIYWSAYQFIPTCQSVCMVDTGSCCLTRNTNTQIPVNAN